MILTTQPLYKIHCKYKIYRFNTIRKYVYNLFDVKNKVLKIVTAAFNCPNVYNP